jgi:hypothetical protein
MPTTRPKPLTGLFLAACFLGVFILSLPFTTIVALPFAVTGQVDTGVIAALGASLLLAILGTWVASKV